MKPRIHDTREFISLLPVCTKSVNIELLKMAKSDLFPSSILTKILLEYKTTFFDPLGR